MYNGIKPPSINRFTTFDVADVGLCEMRADHFVISFFFITFASLLRGC